MNSSVIGYKQNIVSVLSQPNCLILYTFSLLTLPRSFILKLNKNLFLKKVVGRMKQHPEFLAERTEFLKMSFQKELGCFLKQTRVGIKDNIK